jgi:hypothetical protein
LTIYHNKFAALPLRLEPFIGIAARQFTIGEKHPGEFDVYKRSVRVANDDEECSRPVEVVETQDRLFL